MTFRVRLLVAFLGAVLVPMALLMFFVRREMTDRLTAQYERRVESLVSVIEEDLDSQGAEIASSLEVLGESIVDDNDFRRAAVDGDESQRRYLLDYAGNAMSLMGLSMLQIQDETGRIISSGHFRNEYDRLEPELPRLLRTAPSRTALMRARAPDGPFLVLVGMDSFRMGGRLFTIVGGETVSHRFLDRLIRDADLSISLVFPGGEVVSASARHVPPGAEGAGGFSGSEMVRDLTMPFIDAEQGRLSVARVRVTHRPAALNALIRNVDRWFLTALLATALIGVAFASGLASKMSKPLEELAEKTSRIDLDRLDIEFSAQRDDEIGTLSRVLGNMTERLRAGAVRVKDAERRATVGELARQVNHDIKNGLIPIRNVFRHLLQLVRENPEEVPRILEERKATIEGGISYLENLSSNYARLYPRVDSVPVDVNAVARQVVDDFGGKERVRVNVNLCDRAVVRGDPVMLRRILENVISNAIDSVGREGGTVTVSTEIVPVEEEPSRLRITVSDTGSGMDEDELSKIFDDFYTTKEDGTGLGLSIVRRLVMDLDGTVRAVSEPGAGSRFLIEFPAETEQVKRRDPGGAEEGGRQGWQ